MTPETIFFFICALGFFVYWTLAFLVLYHLIRFGVSGQPKKIAVIFLAGSLVLTLVTAILIFQVDLSGIKGLEELQLFNFNFQI